MKFKEIVNAVSEKISGSSQFLWNCYGQNVLIYDFNDSSGFNVGGFVANTEGRVFEINVTYEDDVYYWVDPEFIDALEREKLEKIVIAPDYKEILVLEEEDILQKVRAICNGEFFDKRLMVKMELENDLFLSLAKMAHEKDVTLNEFICSVLEKKMAE